MLVVAAGLHVLTALQGGQMMIADVDMEAGKLTLNTNFVVRPMHVPCSAVRHTHKQADGPCILVCVAGILAQLHPGP